MNNDNLIKRYFEPVHVHHETRRDFETVEQFQGARRHHRTTGAVGDFRDHQEQVEAGAAARLGFWQDPQSDFTTDGLLT